MCIADIFFHKNVRHSYIQLCIQLQHFKSTDLLYQALLRLPPVAVINWVVHRLLTPSVCELGNSFLVSIPPITSASKRWSSDMLLASHLRKAMLMQNHSQAGQRTHAVLKARDTGELWFFPVGQLMKRWTSCPHLVHHLSTNGTVGTPLPVPFKLSQWGTWASFFPVWSLVPRNGVSP